MATTAEVQELPSCYFCGEPAEYDFKTIYGPWAYGCLKHYEAERMFPNLGTGTGQRLVVAKPGEEV